eukprot:Rmarinus@m.16535
MPPPLPVPWEEKYDPTYGRMYYWNPATSESSWERPTCGQGVPAYLPPGGGDAADDIEAQNEHTACMNDVNAAVSPKGTLESQQSRGKSMRNMIGMVNYLHGEVNEEKATPLPPGTELKHDRRGMPIVTTADQEDGTDAEHEHIVKRLPLTCSLDTLEKEFGRGIVYYFYFVRFVLCVNLALALIGVIVWSPQFEKQDRLEWFESFFVAFGSTDDGLYGLWFAGAVVAIIIWFSVGPLYTYYLRRRAEKNVAEDDSEEVEEEELYSGTTGDIIQENKFISRNERLLRFLGSYFVFGACIGLQGLTTWALLQIAGADSSDFFLATVNVALLFVVNLIWKFWCMHLTEFERHKTWTSYRKHNVFKFFLFKLANMLALYFVQYQYRSSEDEACPLNAAGNYFINQMLFDLTVGNLVELLLPHMYMWFYACLGQKTKFGMDEATKQIFDLSEEYLEILYRQFIIYLGSLVVPYLPVLGAFTTSLELLIDRYRLLRLCRKPHRVRSSMKYFLRFFLLLTGLAALLSYPNGAVWILNGGLYDDCYFLNRDLH